ncbi:MAG: ABC transporter substrate-binding protein [Mycobacterium leprae]
MLRRLWPWVASLLLLVSLLPQPALAAGTSGTVAAGTATTPAKKPAVGGELRPRLYNDPDSLLSIWSGTGNGSYVNSLIYASLVRFNEKGEPTPYIAQSWQTSTDGTTWTFKLRSGVRFHDGNELTAEDVLFTLNTILAPEYDGPYALPDAIKSITAPDKYTVQITLKTPYAALLYDVNLGILEKRLFANTKIADMPAGAAASKPVGAGPYRFISYTPGKEVVLERNPNWCMSASYNGAPFIQTIRFKIITNDTDAYKALTKGDTDVDTFNPDWFYDKDKQNLQQVPYDRNGWAAISFNMANPQLSDKRVRLALTYGLDRQALIDWGLSGQGTVPAGPIPSFSWAGDPTMQPLPYDPAKARRLLEEAGYRINANYIYEKDGKPLQFNLYINDSDLAKFVGAIAKISWTLIGVNVTVKYTDFNTLMNTYARPGKFDMLFSGMNLSLDPDQKDLFHSASANLLNYGRYKNADVDKLLEQGLRETDPAKRKAIYIQYQHKLMDDPPVIFTYAQRYSDLINKKVKGYTTIPGVGAANLELWWINEQ